MQNDFMSTPLPVPQPSETKPGCLGELTWLGMGLTLPMVNPAFYRKAAARKFSSALIVFFVFAFILTLLTTITISSGLKATDQALQEAYAKGDFPTITIQDGQASVDAPQPFYILDKPEMLIVLDTTGKISEIDADRYAEGLLLTRDTVEILQNHRGARSIKLSDLQEVLGQNPLVLDQASVSAYWQTFSGIFTLLSFFALAVWHMLVRLGYLALLALLFWPLARQFRPAVGYQTVLGIGVYALIPAMILNHLVTRSGLSFCSLQTMILVPLWALGLWWALRKPAVEGGEPRLRPWEMLIPLPLFALIIVDRLIAIPNGDIYLWGAAGLTLLASVALTRLFPPARAAGAGTPPTIEPLP